MHMCYNYLLTSLLALGSTLSPPPQTLSQRDNQTVSTQQKSQQTSDDDVIVTDSGESGSDDGINPRTANPDDPNDIRQLPNVQRNPK